MGHGDDHGALRVGQALLLLGGLAVAGCTHETSLAVELRTNLLPQVDFVHAQVTVSPLSGDTRSSTELRTRPVLANERDRGDAYLLTEITDLRPGGYRVQVDLLDADREWVTGGAELISVDGHLLVNIVISYDCLGVLCEGGLRCFGSRCVDPGCLPGSRTEAADCPEPLCRDASDCEVSASCATAQCLDGACYLVPNDEPCAPDRCHVERGCVDVSGADAGMDAGPPDAARPDAAACEPSPELCDGLDDDCDGRVDEGFDLASDPRNCGACAIVCPSGPGAAPACESGRCGLSCQPGLADCDGDPSNGCEADLSAAETCGDCAIRCSGATPFCVADAGAARCDSGCGALTDCSGSCVDLQTSRRHCGGCGVACDDGESCVSGTCRCGGTGSDCAGTAASTCCGTLCVDTRSNASHCGGCSLACDDGESCVSSTCRCGGTGSDCAGTAGSTCCGTACVDTRSNASHCGGCDTVCGPYTGGTAGCAMGSCVIASCDGTLGDCDGDPANGCETDRWNDDSHCSSCGEACDPTEDCHAALCCPAGTRNCDTLRSNGCECALDHASTRCSSGQCRIAECDAGYADCDGEPSNGCEVELATDQAHCGACGNECSFHERCLSGTCECDDAWEGKRCGTLQGGRCCGGDCRNTFAEDDNCGGCGISCGASLFCARYYSGSGPRYHGHCTGCVNDEDCPAGFRCGFAAQGGICECTGDDACAVYQTCGGDGPAGSLDACEH